MTAIQRLLSRTRRNHALEHATVHLLSQRHPQTFMAGHSDPEGFWLLGDVSTEEVWAAVTEALERLRNGESRLAIHPGCGTNYLISGGMAALAGAAAMTGVGKRWRDKLDRLSLAVLLGMLALMFSRPLAYKVQEKVTTDARMGALEIVDVIPARRGNFTAHRVLTRG